MTDLHLVHGLEHRGLAIAAFSYFLFGFLCVLVRILDLLVLFPCLVFIAWRTLLRYTHKHRHVFFFFCFYVSACPLKKKIFFGGYIDFTFFFLELSLLVQVIPIWFWNHFLPFLRF